MPRTKTEWLVRAEMTFTVDVFVEAETEAQARLLVEHDEWDDFDVREFVQTERIISCEDNS